MTTHCSYFLLSISLHATIASKNLPKTSSSYKLVVFLKTIDLVALLIILTRARSALFKCIKYSIAFSSVKIIESFSIMAFQRATSSTSFISCNGFCKYSIYLSFWSIGSAELFKMAIAASFSSVMTPSQNSRYSLTYVSILSETYL